VAVVTGAGGGIGAGMAEAFAAEGMHVVVADIEEASAQATAERVRAAGVRSVAVHTDVADPASVAALADRAFAEFGEVHLLCNNAGVLLFRPLAEMSLQDWQWLLSVNLFGVIHGIHSFLPRMLAQGGDGHIVNTASIAGLAVGRVRNVGAYHASKYAVVGLSEALRTELEPVGIGVSMICPGGVNTPLNADLKLPEGADKALFQRLMPLSFPIAEPEEIAAAVAYLASAEARFVNGAVFSIDGGQTAG